MAAMVGLATGLSLLVVPIVAQTAEALVAPIDSVVSAEGLPTTQINGVVWSQGLAGKTVIAGGEFTTAKDVGSTSTVARKNLLAFNIDTGKLVTSFNPTVNGAVKVVAVSPNGKRVYIGGAFTKVGTANRYRLAAFDVATNGTLTLVSNFAPTINAGVKAIVATDATVYVGGDFTSAGGNARSRLAAFSATSGALLAWYPKVDATVGALTIVPDGTKVIAGGSFTTINGEAAYGMGSIGAADGLRKTWKINTTVKNATATSAITSLSTANGQIIGTGYDYGSGGNFEGTFAANPSDGSIKWLEDCHGDTYSAFTQGDAVYTAGHAHDCTNIAGFPEVTPRISRRALAFTTTATGTITANTVKAYSNYGGKPAPSLINWFPELAPGTFTGQTQAAWSVTGNADYIVFGGEFPKVNGKAQQGLVRFATRKSGVATSAPALNGSTMGLAAVSLTGGQVRISVPANYDKDDTSLDYTLYRGGSAIATQTVNSTFFNRPYLTWIDSGVSGSQQYKITVTDGQTLRTSNTITVSVGTTNTASPYSTAVKNAGAGVYWRLGESSGTKVYDYGSVGADGTTGSGVTRSSTGAVAGNGSANFNGTADGSVLLPVGQYGPQQFTIQAWIKTGSTKGGQIIDFGAAATGVSTSADRTLYMSSTGKVSFLTAPSGVNKSIVTSGSYNDNQWHQITATLGGDGQKLYVDGVLQASSAATVSAKVAYGYWRVGGDTVTGFTGAGAAYFSGGIDEVAIYPTALSAAQISSIYGTRAQAAAAPAAADARIAVVEEAPSTSAETGATTPAEVTSSSTTTAPTSTTSKASTTTKATPTTSSSSSAPSTTSATSTTDTAATATSADSSTPAVSTGSTSTGTAGPAAATQPTTSTVVTTTGR